jgi:hypothetical protein
VLRVKRVTAMVTDMVTKQGKFRQEISAKSQEGPAAGRMDGEWLYDV